MSRYSRTVNVSNQGGRETVLIGFILTAVYFLSSVVVVATTSTLLIPPTHHFACQRMVHMYKHPLEANFRQIEGIKREGYRDESSILVYVRNATILLTM